MKKHFKQAIRKEWNRRLKEECAGKASLRWLHLPPDEQLHIIWRYMNCPSHTRKATINAMMTTGCYILQADVKRFYQNEVNATCGFTDISVNPRTSTTPCAGVPTRRLRSPESASYRDSSGYFTLHRVLIHTTQHGLLSRAMPESIAMSCRAAVRRSTEELREAERR